MKTEMLTHLQIVSGTRVLDLGCGTGTLLALALQHQPKAEYVGLDIDPQMLAQARAKLASLQASIELVQASAAELPFADASFDIVCSSLAFHHLNWPLKQRAAFEIQRVLKPGSSFYLLDFSRPRTPGLLALSLLTRWLEEVKDQARGRLPWLLQRAGLSRPESLAIHNTWLGTIELLKAGKP